MTSPVATSDNKSRPPPLPPSKPGNDVIIVVIHFFNVSISALRHRTNDVTALSRQQRSPVTTPDSDIRLRVKSSAQHTDHIRLPSNGSNATPVRCKSFLDDVIDRRNQLSGRHSVLLPSTDSDVANQMTSSPAAPSRSMTSSLYHRNSPSGLFCFTDFVILMTSSTRRSSWILFASKINSSIRDSSRRSSTFEVS